jgi:hypothetical protein
MNKLYSLPGRKLLIEKNLLERRGAEVINIER